jgi:hypothetical protein
LPKQSGGNVIKRKIYAMYANCRVHCARGQSNRVNFILEKIRNSLQTASRDQIISCFFGRKSGGRGSEYPKAYGMMPERSGDEGRGSRSQSII